MTKTVGYTLLVLLGMVLTSYQKPDEPIELGTVKWNRELEQAKARSAQTGKPLFVQFQEVPG